MSKKNDYLFTIVVAGKVQHLHRLGRAARAGRTGRATNFYDDSTKASGAGLGLGRGGGRKEGGGPGGVVVCTT